MVIGGKGQKCNTVTVLRCLVPLKRVDSLSIPLRTFCLSACLIVERSALQLKSQTHIVHTVVHLGTRKNEEVRRRKSGR